MGELKRRTFLEIAAGAAVVPSAGKSRFSGADVVELGKTGIRSSRLCFGTGVKSNNRRSSLGDLGRENAVALLRQAYERGVRCFDMADSYGTHALVAEAMAPFPRSSYTLMTKIWWRKGGIPDDEKKPASQMVDRFLRELKTDFVDVVQLHCVTDGDWPQKMEKMTAGLEACKKAGKIRAHGLSMHSFSAMETAVVTPWADVCHVRINPFKVLMDASVEEVSARVRALHARGAGVVGMKILGEGWVGQYPKKIDESLAFALHSGVVDVLNIGFLDIREIDDILVRISRVS